MKKRLWAIVIGLSVTLPAVASPAGCDNGLTAGGAGPTFLRLFAKKECLKKYGITIPE